MKIQFFQRFWPLLFLVGSCAQAQPKTLQNRWFYLQTNFQSDENVPKTQELLRRAKKAGYNGMVVTDSKFDRLNSVPQRYFDNVEKVKKTAQELGIAVYPVVATVGYEGGVLAQDPTLAEGFRVENARFKVENGVADIAPDVSQALKNGGFESAQNDKFADWTFQDGPGKSTFLDSSIKREGASSIRMENFAAGNDAANARIYQSVSVSPRRQYRFSVWVKTQNLETPQNARAVVLDAKSKQISFAKWKIEKTQDWTRFEGAFNSLENREVRIYFGVWGGRGGKIWWDDAQFEEAGLSNLLRREGCPFVVKSENGKIFQENRDFLAVSDPKSGNVSWSGNYDSYHQPPKIQIAPDSRIEEGQTLSVSFYHAQPIDGGSVAPCLTSPKFYEILEDQMRRVNQLWRPKGLFLGHDEIRQINQCALCQKRNLTPGEILADNAKKCIEIARKINPNADLWIWSDMFDPHHNARADYYLVNGDLKNSWQGLDEKIGIANWNFDSRDQSLQFFNNRNHRQLLAGYYDADLGQIRGWLDSAKPFPRADGVMYTTWENNYADLENFARLAWGEGAKP